MGSPVFRSTHTTAKGREPVLVAVVVDGVEVGAERHGVAEEQLTQGVVGDGTAVRRVCDEGLGPTAWARPGVFVPAVFVEAAGQLAGKGFLLECGLGSKVCPGILPGSGPGEPPGPVSASQWLPLSVRSGDAGRVARPVAQRVLAVLDPDHGHGGVIRVGPGRGGRDPPVIVQQVLGLDVHPPGAGPDGLPQAAPVHLPPPIAPPSTR